MQFKFQRRYLKIGIFVERLGGFIGVILWCFVSYGVYDAAFNVIPEIVNGHILNLIKP